MKQKLICGIFVAVLAAVAIAEGQTWTTQGIGTLGVAGTSTALSADAFTVTGSGADIAGTADAFEFVYQALTGDGSVVARVKSVPNVDPSSKAGVMIRETLAANARNAVVFVSRDNGVQFSVRKTTGGMTTVNGMVAGRTAPQWLKLVRSGAICSAYTSKDNVTWELLGSDTVSMAGTVYVGMVVTSRKNTTLGAAGFDQVLFAPGTVADASAPAAPVLVSGSRSNASVALSWSGASDDVGISSYCIERNGVAVATVPGTSSAYVDNGLTPTTQFAYEVKAIDASGKVSQASNRVSLSTHAAETGVFAASQDIGTVGIVGSTLFDPTSSTYTLQGAGAGIGGTADACRFAYQQCSGDEQIVVRVGSIQYTSPFSKAGAMIRESLAANATEASIMLTHSRGVVFQTRAVTGGATATSATYAYASILAKRAPQWVKLVRQGNNFKGFVSADGVSWEYVGGNTIAMASSAFAGLAVTSHNVAALCSAVFTNLHIGPAVDTGTPSQPSGLSIYSLSDVSLSLSWNPAGADVAVDSYRIFQDGAWIGTTPFARFTDTFQDAGTTHSYSVQAVNAAGRPSLASSPLSVTLKAATLPAPWQHDDIGTVDWAGTASLNGGLFGISGAGLGIGANEDSFHYIYQPLNGNQTIVARISSIPNPPNTSVKVGVMIRETLDAGSRNAFFLVLGGVGANMQYRPSTDGTTAAISGNATAKAPYWVKLVRGGSRFAGYHSADGANWKLAGVCSVPMGAAGYIGVALTSHDPRVIASATVDSVQILADSDNNGMADSWELGYFNKIGVDPAAIAPRNDGLTNLQAYQQGLNPIDYYNGIAPTVTKVSGDNQNGAINALLAHPLVFRLTGAGGTPLANAPVTISVPVGGGLVSSAPGSASSTTLVVHSDADGKASVCYKKGSRWAISSQIKVVAGKTTSTFAATALPLVGRWPFASHNGTITPDTSKTGNAANAIGAVTWGVGFDGTGAISLDGSTGYVEVAASPTMALGTGPLSLTGWVKLPQNLALNDESIIYPLVTMGDGIVDGLSLCVRGGGHGLEAHIHTATGIVKLNGNVTMARISDGNWHQVGFLSDGTGTVSLTFDGAIVASQAGVQLPAVAAPRLWLGRDGAGHFFRGDIDEVELRRDALTAADVLARYNVDNNKNGMADAWEWQNFGTLRVAPTADADGDGVTNLQEFKNGTSPNDYFNGIAPVITILSGDNQNGAPGSYLAQGLGIKVTKADGTVLANAPVTFSVQSGGGFVAATNTATTMLATVAVRTGADGSATAYYKTGSVVGTSSQIQAVAGKSSCTFGAGGAPLVAQWDFSDGSGTAASDSSRTGNVFALHGGATWDVGYDGKGAVTLDGKSGFLATAPSSTLTLATTSALTLATWVRLPKTLSLKSDQNIYPIATMGRTTADSLSLFIQGGANAAKLVLSKGSVVAASATFAVSDLADGNWHHVALVSDGKSNLTLVFDGRILVQVAGQLPAIASPRVWFGRDASGRCFNGSFDDAIIRRDAMPLADLQRLYNMGAEIGALPNWWKWKQLGTLNVDADAVSEGTTNLQKYQAEIAPVVSVSDLPNHPAGRGLHSEVLWERWCGPELMNTGLEDIRRFGKYPSHPDQSRALPTFEIRPADGIISSASRLRAYLVAPMTGAYRFYTTGQNSASLYVSLSGKSYERLLACTATNIAPNTWTKSSDVYYLKAGTRYYLELIVKGERQPGFGQVGWTTPTNGTPALIPSDSLISMGAEDDTNDVGMSDEWQMDHFGALTQWPNQDADGDGLTNLQEFQRGTDPMNYDTGISGVGDAGKQAGFLTYDYWLNVDGASVADFLAGSRYTQAPDGRSIIDRASEPSLLSQKYASVIRGYFVPAVTGSYGFQAKAGSDGVAAFLSADEHPENMQLLFDKISTPATRTLTAGRRYYFEFVHKVDVGTVAASLYFLPPGATVYAPADASQFVPLDAPGVSPQAALPVPWQRGEISVNRGWAAYSGLSTMDASGALEILAAGKTANNTHSDGLHWIYQMLPDGGQIQTRLLGCDYLSSARTAGLMIRQGLESGSPLAMLRRNPNGTLAFSCRLVQDGAVTSNPSIAYAQPTWMRLLRKGSTVYAYTSLDGIRWTLFNQANLNLIGPAYVGAFATSGAETQFCRATFDSLSAGVDPTVAAGFGTTDTDGDGYSNYEETQFLHSNPLLSDLQPPVTVGTLAGSAGSSAIGTWSTNGAAIYNISVRGAVDYKINVPQDGIYRLAVQGTPRVNTISNTAWDVLVSVDGQYLETVRYELAMGQTGLAHVYTPWLTAGTHTIRLYLNNVSIYRSFAFTSLVLEAIDGADANNNGIPDWMENRLAAQNGITSLATQGRTSPFCLEGTSFYQQAARLTADNQPVAMLQGVGDGWYANIALNPDAPVAVTAEFENGGKTDQKAITWLATNLLNPGVPGNTLKIRKGDALLLAAAPADVATGSASITVTLADNSTEALQTSGMQTVQYQFTQAGTYTLDATYHDGVHPDSTGSLTVQVIEAAFSKPNPFVSLGYAREWLNPLLPDDAVVESDSRMEVMELPKPATGGRDFRLRIDAPETRVLLARLNDGTPNGPILDRAVIAGVEICSGAQTGIYLLEQYSDGSRLVEMRVILSDIPADFRGNFSIFAAGVTFEDGSLSKWITKADFDDQGQLKIRFIMAPQSYTSVCHRLYIYQGESLLEMRIN